MNRSLVAMELLAAAREVLIAWREEEDALDFMVRSDGILDQDTLVSVLGRKHNIPFSRAMRFVKEWFGRKIDTLHGADKENAGTRLMVEMGI